MSIDMKALHLPDESFWGKGDRILDPVIRQHGRSYFGVAIDAPAKVNLAERHTLPAFVYYMGSFQQMASRDLDKHGVIAVMDVDQNYLKVVRAGSQDGGEDPDPDAPKPPNLGIVSQGYGSSAQTVELRERLELPWKPARLILQAILLDLPSPRIETKLVSGASQFEDPEVQKFLAAERAALNPPAPFPSVTEGAAYPSFTKEDGSAELPVTMGISLKAQRVIPVDGKAPVVLHGAWRLPMMPEDIVKPDNKEYNRTSGLLQPDGTPYAAVATIHILVIGTSDGKPKVYRVSAPVRSVAPTGVAAGYFAIDLLKMPEFPAGDQTVFVHAFAREWAADPVTIGLLNRRPQD
jgi:hypothetical protein